MAIKTVSLEVDAYEILSRARKHPRESFSCVVRRAHWDGPQYTGATILAYMRERSRLGGTLSRASMDRLCLADRRTSHPAAMRSSGEAVADAYLIDRSIMTEMELEVEARVEGPVMTFLAGHPVSVFCVSVITAGQFSAVLAESDAALGTQVLRQFELKNLSALIAERYARELRLQSSEDGAVQLASDDLWLGCTATATQSPLITRHPEKFAGITDLRVLVF